MLVTLRITIYQATMYHAFVKLVKSGSATI